MFSGRRQPSRDGTSRMTRECHVRICERLGVKFPGPTRQNRKSPFVTATSVHPSGADIGPRARHIRFVPTADVGKHAQLRFLLLSCGHPLGDIGRIGSLFSRALRLIGLARASSGNSLRMSR